MFSLTNVELYRGCSKY